MAKDVASSTRVPNHIAPRLTALTTVPSARVRCCMVIEMSLRCPARWRRGTAATRVRAPTRTRDGRVGDRPYDGGFGGGGVRGGRGCGGVRVVGRGAVFRGG